MLERFYRENYHIVYGYLLCLCGDPVLAEELAAETFYKAIARIEKYDPAYKPSTWLCSIGRNLFYDECRRQKRFANLEEATWCYVPSAETVFLQKETITQIKTTLKTFSPELRQLFRMRLQGMAFRDIGLALGKSENWARVTYFRIKSKIRLEMEGE